MSRRRVTSYPSPGPENALWRWNEVVPLGRVTKNYILMGMARVVPSMQLRVDLLRWMGAKVGDNVSWGLEAMMDILFPEKVTIGENSIIGYNSVILAHEFLIKEYRVGEVFIGKDVVIGANCTVLPGVRIEDGSVVSAGSLVNCDVKGFVGGVPARPIISEGKKN
jgi:acetyltransferase-like isoleucine patch superfamily enzyme